MAVIRATRASFRNDYDKVAFAVHATFLASGFVLTATGPSAFTEAAFSSPSTGMTYLCTVQNTLVFFPCLVFLSLRLGFR